MTGHKPRKRRHHEPSSAGSSRSTIVTDAESGYKRPAFPLAAFLWPAMGSGPWLTLPLILMAVFLFRLATGFWGYSGFQSPPMHGDFEAQRHWMEVTTELPISHWYFHDLQWWGLDYPPLTAYHSWLMGKVGAMFDPSWFALRTSRGLDDPMLKIYMRATVLVSEYVTYIPASIVLVRRYSRLQSVNSWDASIALVAILMQPATMLIDHGHFQYNTVMLGFVLASMLSMMAGRLLWACVFFVASLGFKQMALFYAPAIFAYLLGSSVFPHSSLLRLISIALITLLSFALLFMPLLLGALYDSNRGIQPPSDVSTPPLLATLATILPFPLSPTALYHAPLLQLTQSIHRIFPFARGLFEDKVANLWCALHASGLHKLHHHSTPHLQRLALLATTAAITPPTLILLLKSKKALLPWSLAATAWAFYLCSYQVHEKNVLLPLLPTTLLLAADNGLAPRMRAWVGFANALGAWTLFPLLKRDGLRVPYFVLVLLWAWLLGLPPLSLSAYRQGQPHATGWLAAVLHLGAYAAMVAWHVCEQWVVAPVEKPDLWVVGNVVVGAGGFGLCYLWCVWELLSRSGLLPRRNGKAADGVKKDQ